jgi:hypothetical protein
MFTLKFAINHLSETGKRPDGLVPPLPSLSFVMLTNRSLVVVCSLTVRLSIFSNRSSVIPALGQRLMMQRLFCRRPRV